VIEQPAPEAPWFCRFYREGDEPGMLRVLQASFSPWPKVETSVLPLDHLRWKMASHPIATRFHLVAEHGAEIIAVRLFIVREVIFAGRTLLSYQPVDISVHPEYQNQGLLKYMRTLDYNRLEDRTYAETFDLKLAYESGHPAAMRLQVEIPGSFLFGNQLEVLSRSNDGHASGPPQAAPFGIRTVSAFDDRLDVFWREAARPFDLILVRTKDVMNWRYSDARAGNFTIVIAEHNGMLLGYALTRCSRGRGYIADLLALPGRSDVAEGLVRAALVQLRGQPLERIECWLPARHPYQPLLRDLGFAPRKSRVRARYRPFLTSERELELLRHPDARIHFTAGDTDLV
jgi:GNAT superfamily N-acetyltransferase